LSILPTVQKTIVEELALPPQEAYYRLMGVRVKFWKIDKHGQKRYRIRWDFKGKEFVIYKDQIGDSLIDKVKTMAIANEIALEIDHKKHDPTRWLPEKRNKYIAKSAISFYLSERMADADSGYITFKQLEDITRYLNRNFLPWLEENNLTDIRDIKGIELQLFFRSQEKGGKKWSYKTRKNCLSAIMAFFRWTVGKAELLDKIPAIPDIGRAEEKVIKWLTDKQQVKVLEAIPEKYKPIFQLLMVYGCRPSEALALQLEDIDYENETVIIRHTISDNKLKERTKTNTMRFLPILEEFRNTLLELTTNRIGVGYLFINPKTGERFSIWSLQDIWRKACKKTGIGNITLQEGTRKAVATRLMNYGFSKEDASMFLGNSPEILKKHYAQITAERFKKLIPCNVINISDGRKNK